MYNARLQSMLLAAVILLVCTASPVEAAPKWTPVGEWQDAAAPGWNQTLRILRSDDGYVLECSFASGTKIHSVLVPVKSKKGETQRFKDTESDFGEEYAVLASGDLALYRKLPRQADHS